MEKPQGQHCDYSIKMICLFEHILINKGFFYLFINAFTMNQVTMETKKVFNRKRLIWSFTVIHEAPVVFIVWGQDSIVAGGCLTPS